MFDAFKTSAKLLYLTGDSTRARLVIYVNVGLPPSHTFKAIPAQHSAKSTNSYISSTTNGVCIAVFGYYLVSHHHNFAVDFHSAGSPISFLEYVTGRGGDACKRGNTPDVRRQTTTHEQQQLSKSLACCFRGSQMRGGTPQAWFHYNDDGSVFPDSVFPKCCIATNPGKYMDNRRHRTVQPPRNTITELMAMPGQQHDCATKSNCSANDIGQMRSRPR